MKVSAAFVLKKGQMLGGIFFFEGYMDCHNVSSFTHIILIFMPALWGHDKSRLQNFLKNL
jgi:hypothetical protein